MKLLLHPLPVRIFHWVMVACVLALVLTGFYIHSPPAALQAPMSLVRKIHGGFAFILIVNLLCQTYYYAVTTKFTEVLFLPRDLKNLRSFFRYYLFITEGHPNYGRYNPGQKIVFTSWALAIAAAAVTGTALMFSDHSFLLQRWLGGLNTFRIIQYFIAVYFAVTVPVHLYLVFTEDPAKLQAIFTGYLKKEPKQIYSKQSHK